MQARELGIEASIDIPEGAHIADFEGVNLDTALEECYDRMSVIGEIMRFTICCV